MKTAGLIIGILLIILSVIGAIVCLLLPSMTNNRVDFDEALLGLIPAALVFFLGLAVAGVSAFLVFRARKNAATLK